MSSLSLTTAADQVRRWPYPSYGEYVAYQAKRARRTSGITRHYGRIRAKLADLLRKHAPEVETLLCLGARHRVEVEDFRRRGYRAEGIDLIEDEIVRRCDMANLDGDAGLHDCSFDAFVCAQSLEHCWDFDGFIRRSLPHCRNAVVAAVPVSLAVEVTPWQCSAFDFQRPEALPVAFESLFVGFQLIHREVRNNLLYFVLRRFAAPNAVHPTAGQGVMRNVLVANHLPGSKHSQSSLERLIFAQIDNSLEIGWRAENLLLVTNFAFQYRGVTAITTKLNQHCLRGSKMFAVEKLLNETDSPDTILWAHDLDCWQNCWFDAPEFAEIGACEYSRPTFNGGSIFWRPSARDIAAEIVCRLRNELAACEEPTLNEIFRDPRHRQRVTVLNPTYNVGCSGFKHRLSRSEKPVRASHFHPTNRLAWETHVLNRHHLVERSASPRLERVIRRWFPRLPTAVMTPNNLDQAERGRRD